jgi:hypothetical protein
MKDFVYVVVIFSALAGGYLAGLHINKNAVRLAGPPFIVRNSRGGFFICSAEFDKFGQLIRKGEK